MFYKYNEQFLRVGLMAVVICAMVVLSEMPLHSNVQGQSSRKTDLREDTVRNLPGSSKRYALVIGVDKYQDTQITTLGGATNDAKSLADALVKYAGFPSDQVILLASDQPIERQPTRGNIIRRLSNLRSALQASGPKEGLLLVSFAGHGMERNGKAYLLPSDAQVSGDVSVLEDTALNVESIKERIKQTGVGQVLMVIDACRNDPAGRSDTPNPLSEAYTRGFNFDVRNREVIAFATLYATEIGNRAYEYKEKQQGYFTWALVEGLKGGAANDKGEVTLSQLVNYVQEVVPKRITLDLGAGKQQRPFAVIEGYKADELVVAVASKISANTITEAQPAKPATLELDLWNTIKDSNDPADYQAYLKKYPDGEFADIAKNRIRKFEITSHKREKDEQETIAQKPEQESRSVQLFEVEHFHTIWYGRPNARGRLYILPNGVKFEETGEHGDPKCNFEASCPEIKLKKPDCCSICIKTSHKNYCFYDLFKGEAGLIFEKINAVCGSR